MVLKGIYKSSWHKPSWDIHTDAYADLDNT